MEEEADRLVFFFFFLITFYYTVTSSHIMAILETLNGRKDM